MKTMVRNEIKGKISEPSYYLQWVMPEEYKGEDLIMAIHHFIECNEKGCIVDSYGIVPNIINFESAAFNGLWDVREEDIWLRISKEQFEVWKAKVENLKKQMFAIAEGNAYNKEYVEAGDIIMSDEGFYKILEVQDDPFDAFSNFVYIGEHGIQFRNEDSWLESYDEVRSVRNGTHVEKSVFDQAVNMACEFTKILIEELKEFIKERQ